MEVLQPLLESKARNSWVDPREFKNNDEFVYAYSIARGWALAVEELLRFVNEETVKAEGLDKKLKDESLDPFKQVFR